MIVKWNNDVLEPVLITYNRYKYLERTLQFFLDAGLTNMRLHVLDNASTDQTQEIVKKFQLKWPNLQYHRNKYNIGGNANILRAVELTNSEYFWVIGDDDDWHFDTIAELITVLNEKKADIIRLGWLVPAKSRGKAVSAVELAYNETLFFSSISMISATIYRRSVFTKNLAHAYMNIGDAYPQLVPAMMEIGDTTLTVHSIKDNLMTHIPNTDPGYYFGDLEWYSNWYRSSRFIQDKNLRIKFISEVTQYMLKGRKEKSSQLVWLIKVALNYKALGVSQFKYIVTMLAYGEGMRSTILAVLFAHSLLPQKLLVLLRKQYLKANNIQDKGLQADRSRL